MAEVERARADVVRGRGRVEPAAAERLPWTQSHVPGITCMTPRALALETIALLKPLSCQPIAAASEPGDAVLGGDRLDLRPR